MSSDANAGQPHENVGEDIGLHLSLFDVLASASGTQLLEIIDRVFKAAARKASEESHALGLEVADGRNHGKLGHPEPEALCMDRLERALEKAAQERDDGKGLMGLRRAQAERSRRNFIFNHVDFSKAKIVFGDDDPIL